MHIIRTSRFFASLLVAVLIFTSAPLLPAPDAAFAALPTATLNAVTFVLSSTTATVIAVGASGTILRSTNDGDSWTSVGPGGTNNLTGVSFRDASNGLAVSSTGTVFYTSNGGASWSLSSPNLDGDPYSGTVHDVAFVSTSEQPTAFAAGRMGLTTGNTDSAVIWQRMTTDGGGEWVNPVTWDRPYINTTADNALEGAGDFFALDFPSTARGYAVGHDRYKETSQPAAYNHALVYFYGGSPTPTWSTAGDAKRLSDGGPLSAVSFATDARGIAVGTAGKVFRTIDSGSIWTQSSAGSTDLLGAAMTTQNNGWVVGKGGVAGRTTNGGADWSMQTIAAGIELRDVATRGGDSNIAVAVGTSGRIMRTTNGTDWSQAGEASVPTGTITLNSGDAATNSTNVTATHTVNWAGGGTGQMRHSVDGGTSWIGGGDGWVTYADTRSISLPAGDGTKTVRVGFKAADGTESTALIEDTIKLDTTAPTGTIAINDGAAATNATVVTVNNSVNFAVADAHATEAMRFTVNGGTPLSTWEPYAASKALTLPAGDGTKTVTGEFKDAAGNVASLSDTIKLDTTAPTGSITINGGDTTTTSAAVTVAHSVTWGVSGAGKMRHSVDGGATWVGGGNGWVTYEPTRQVTLPGSDGTKWVYAEFADAAGNVSNTTISASITLDTTAATVTRLWDTSRFSTAVEIAREGFPNWTGVTSVVIASGDDRAAADPLSASGLCWAYDAPMLLVSAARTPDEVKAAISQIVAANGAITLYIVGGPVSVPDTRVAELVAAGGGAANVATDRILPTGGRYDLAAAIALRMKSVAAANPAKTMPSVALFANGADATKFFDALALSPIAAGTGAPILLVTADSVPSATMNAVNTLKPATRIVGGGPNTVSEKVRSQLSAVRWAGRTRYETAIAIADGAVWRGWLMRSHVGIAAKLPDALTGGSFVGRKGGVLLLTDGATLTPVTKTWLSTHKAHVRYAYVFGGPLSITESVRTAIANALK